MSHSRELRILGSSTDGRNPFVRLMAEAVTSFPGVGYVPYSLRDSLSGRVDIWHFNWPEAAYRSGSAVLCALRCLKLIGQITVARRRGTRIVWMVHNLEPHHIQFPRVERRFWHAFRKRVDGYVHLSTAGGAWFRQEFGETQGKHHLHVKHPAYPAPMEEADGRFSQRPAGLRLLMFGSIQPYKAFPAAISAFRSMPSRGELELVVAGRPVTALLRDEIVEAAADDPRVVLALERLSDGDLESALRSSDAVVVPYGRFLNSGSLMLALSRCRPVLAPATPVTRELAEDIGHDWVFLYEDQLNGAVLARFVDILGDRNTQPELPSLPAYRWESLGASLVGFYEEVCGRAE